MPCYNLYENAALAPRCYPGRRAQRVLLGKMRACLMKARWNRVVYGQGMTASAYTVAWRMSEFRVLSMAGLLSRIECYCIRCETLGCSSHDPFISTRLFSSSFRKASNVSGADLARPCHVFLSSCAKFPRLSIPTARKPSSSLSQSNTSHHSSSGSLTATSLAAKYILATASDVG
jgi:hypothetical protein